MVRLVVYWWRFQGSFVSEVIKSAIFGGKEMRDETFEKHAFVSLHKLSFLALGGLPSWPRSNFASSLSGVGWEHYGCRFTWLRQGTGRGRSGAGLCTDWEQREQLMIAYQRPRFTPSSCFWEWASSTAPQRRVRLWDLTFSNLIKSDEKKPASAYDPPPQMEWPRRCSSMISSQRTVNHISAPIWCWEKKKMHEVFFFSFSFMTRSIETSVWTCFRRLPRLRLLLGDSCTHGKTLWQRLLFLSRWWEKNSGYYSRRLQHLNVTQTSADAPEILMTEIYQFHSATYHVF